MLTIDQCNHLLDYLDKGDYQAVRQFVEGERKKAEMRALKKGKVKILIAYNTIREKEQIIELHEVLATPVVEGVFAFHKDIQATYGKTEYVVTHIPTGRALLVGSKKNAENAALYLKENEKELSLVPELRSKELCAIKDIERTFKGAFLILQKAREIARGDKQ